MSNWLSSKKEQNDEDLVGETKDVPKDTETDKEKDNSQSNEETKEDVIQGTEENSEDNSAAGPNNSSVSEKIDSEDKSSENIAEPESVEAKHEEGSKVERCKRWTETELKKEWRRFNLDLAPRVSFSEIRMYMFTQQKMFNVHFRNKNEKCRIII